MPAMPAASQHLQSTRGDKRSRRHLAALQGQIRRHLVMHCVTDTMYSAQLQTPVCPGRDHAGPELPASVPPQAIYPQTVRPNWCHLAGPLLPLVHWLANQGASASYHTPAVLQCNSLVSPSCPSATQCLAQCWTPANRRHLNMALAACYGHALGCR